MATGYDNLFTAIKITAAVTEQINQESTNLREQINTCIGLISRTRSIIAEYSDEYRIVSWRIENRIATYSGDLEALTKSITKANFAELLSRMIKTKFMARSGKYLSSLNTGFDNQEEFEKFKAMVNKRINVAMTANEGVAKDGTALIKELEIIQTKLKYTSS
jgi:hypothetical protein